VVVYVGLTGVLMARVLVRLVAVGQSRMVVLVLVIGGQVRPVLATAEVMGYVGVLVVVDLGIVAVLLTHGQTLLSPGSSGRSVAQSVTSRSSRCGWDLSGYEGGPAGSSPASGSPLLYPEPVVGSSASARLRMASNGPPATAATSSTTTAMMSTIAMTRTPITSVG